MNKLFLWFYDIITMNKDQQTQKQQQQQQKQLDNNKITECIEINDIYRKQKDLHNRVQKMKATLNGEDRWMLTLKERVK